MLGENQRLGSAIFAGAEASLLWDKDMFDTELETGGSVSSFRAVHRGDTND